MLKTGLFNFLLLVEFTHSDPEYHNFNYKTNDYSAVLGYLQLLSFEKGAKYSKENIWQADADTNILLVGGVKLASVVTTSFEQKKHSQITS